MHFLIVLLAAVSGADAGPGKESEAAAEFLRRLETVPWPESLSNHPAERIERDTEGQVIRLRLDGMQFKADDFTALGELARVESIVFNYSNITDAQIQQLAALKQLKWLQLNHTAIGDEGVKALANIPKLQSLCLGGVPASHDAVVALKRAKPKLSLGYFRDSK